MATSSGPQSKNNNPGKTTPDEFDVFADARSRQGSGEYPNYSSWKSRSGHSIMLDDTDGKENLIIQHRSGTALQMLPNGAMHMVTNHGHYQIVFGLKQFQIYLQ